MHAPQVGLAHLKLLKQVDQLLTLLAINPGAQLGLIVDGDLSSLLEHGAALPREEQPAHAPVLRIGPPLDEAHVLQVVDQRDHPARGNLEPLGKRVLRLAVGGGDEAHQEEVLRPDAEWVERLHETPRREEAQLRDQKADAARSALGLGLLDAELCVLHNTKITLETYSCYKLFRLGTIAHTSEVAPCPR